MAGVLQYNANQSSSSDSCSGRAGVWGSKIPSLWKTLVCLHQANERERTWTNIIPFVLQHSLDLYLQVFTLSEHSPVCGFPCSEKIKIVPCPIHRLNGYLLLSFIFHKGQRVRVTDHFLELMYTRIVCVISESELKKKCIKET